MRKLVHDTVRNISKSIANEDVYDQISWMNEQIAELRNNTKSYSTIIHQLEDALKKQVFNRDANDAEIHRLRDEITKQVQNYKNLSNHFKTYSSRSNRYRPTIQAEFDRNTVIYDASVMAAKMKHVNGLKRNAVEHICTGQMQSNKRLRTSYENERAFF